MKPVGPPGRLSLPVLVKKGKLMDTMQLLKQAATGFATIKVGQQYKDSALIQLKTWLTDPQFAAYTLQLEHLITAGHFDYLLDCFYQVIPFGTGGRRGEVGIGPNRINPWTIQASAQGHSQFLLKKYGESAKKRGVVLAYDVRHFYTNKFFDTSIPNPVADLDGRKLAETAAEVYAANGISVYIFDGYRTTPELSFAVRHLNAVSGDVFSASHNPPEHNGKKVYDEFGGQLIPPFDEELVTEVTDHVTEIKTLAYDQAVAQKLVTVIGKAIDDAYIQECIKLSLSSARGVKIVYTPLHGCGLTSVPKALEALGFTVELDPATSNPSGKFENVTFNIPNPEVIQSFDTPLKHAKKVNADILLNSDPDADRIGVMVNHHGEWLFVNGNEIAAIITNYVIEKQKNTITDGIIIKTDVTTNLVTEIAKANGVTVIGDLLVGFKYVGEEVNKLEAAGKVDSFLMGCEESHGYMGGNYVRDKDAVSAAIWLAELAAELKQENKTLIDYLNEINSTYGYFANYLTEIRLPGAEGMSQIQAIQKAFRSEQPSQIGEFAVEKVVDWLNRTPIVSETDRVSKNALVFYFKPVAGTISMRITVRPSGTEPKIKMYFEIGSLPMASSELARTKQTMTELREKLEKAFMLHCYKAIGVEFPERGFLLFWQLPLKDKLKYFEIEPQIEALKEVSDQPKRQQQLNELLAFLGSDPIMKVDKAFQAKHQQTINEYLHLTA